MGAGVASGRGDTLTVKLTVAAEHGDAALALHKLKGRAIRVEVWEA
jgi:hypothetical protein